MSSMEIPLEKVAAQSLTFQTYDPPAEIEGVFLAPLARHLSLEGSFMELARLSEGIVDGLPVSFEPRQVSVSAAAPGRVNAFHVHPKVRQDELWCVITGALKVWLVDVRAGSPTVGARRAVILSGETPQLLHIPAGVAHGYRAGPEGAVLLYLSNQQFNRADPNEGRLPWDAFGAELWQDDRG